MINIKGCSALATALKQEEKTAWLERQSPRVQNWAARYEKDKQKQKDELATIGKEVTNAEVKFASKKQRREIMVRPKVLPVKARVVFVESKQARRIRVDPMTEGLEVFRYRWGAIKNILWDMGYSTWIPRWYRWFGDPREMMDDRAVARDVVFMRGTVAEMGLRC